MKKSMKILSILMITVMLVMVATPVFAQDAGQVIEGIDTTYSGDDTIKAKIGKFIGFLQWIGIIAGVAIIAIFGIKYMMGSLEEKAEYKKTMIPFIVGAVVLMLAPQIAKFIFTMLN